MRAEELMIGDWILVNDIPIQIQAIDVIDNEIMADDELYVLVGDKVHSEDEIDPISLTPEILEKNGFNDDGEGVYGNDDSYLIPTYRGVDAGTWETHIEPTEGIGDFSGKLRYVHELQHALRLCGINKEMVL